MWAAVAVMIIAALLMTACDGNGGGPCVDEDGKYGGTLTTRRIGWQMKGFDPLVWDNNNMLNIVFDRYFTADWDKGPSGTNYQFPFWKSAYYPIGDYIGEYLADFERISLWRVEFELREGIPYWNKAPVNGREMTVDDILWNAFYLTFHPRAGTYMRSDPASALSYWTDLTDECATCSTAQAKLEAHLDQLRVETPLLEASWPFAGVSGMGNTLEEHMRTYYADSYTVVNNAGYDTSGNCALLGSFYQKLDDYNFVLWSARGSQGIWAGLNGIWPTPPEVTSVDEFTNWETIVATGPWIPQDFVPSSGATFVRNDDYWQDHRINTGDQLPYLDEWEILMIEDESSYYAALESKQLDIGAVEWYKVGYFTDNYVTGKGDEAMYYADGLNGWTHCIFVRNDIPPFDDVQVRHACMLAIDHDAILTHYEGTAIKHSWPEQEWIVSGFTPFDELPTATQHLWDHAPSEAEALLDAAGYPNGFETTMVVYPSSEDQESCLIVKEDLEAVGINITINVPDAATYGSILYGRNYEHMISCWWGNNFPGDVLDWAEGGDLTSPYNFGNVNDPTAHDVSMQMDLILDDETRFDLLETDNIRRLGLMYQILVPTPVGGSFCWPWLQDAIGVFDGGWPDESGWGEVPKYLWIDECVKESMT